MNICNFRDEKDCDEYGIGLFAEASKFEELSIGSKVLYGPVISSTQMILRSDPRFLKSLPSGTVLVANQQTHGRGRGTASWTSLPGCLQFSAVVDFDLSLNDQCQIQMVQYIVAIGIVDSLKIGSETADFYIKWPNDIYSRGHKIGGILVNAENFEDSIKLIIGVGINVLVDESGIFRAVNDELRYNQLTELSRESVLFNFCRIFEALFQSWAQSGEFPFEPYYRNWLFKSVKEIRHENGETVGVRGIDKSGFLVLENLSKPGLFYTANPTGTSFDVSTLSLKPKV